MIGRCLQLCAALLSACIFAASHAQTPLTTQFQSHPHPLETPRTNPSPATAAVSKEDVLHFLRQLKQAVDTDAFADPKKLEAVLGLKTENWKSERAFIPNLGSYSWPEIFIFQQDWLNQRKNDVSDENRIIYVIRKYDEAARYKFHFRRFDLFYKVSAEDVQEVFGKKQIKPTNVPTTLPGRITTSVLLKYDYETDVDKKFILFLFEFDEKYRPLYVKEFYVSKSNEFIQRERLKYYEQRRLEEDRKLQNKQREVAPFDWTGIVWG